MNIKSLINSELQKHIKISLYLKHNLYTFWKYGYSYYKAIKP